MTKEEELKNLTEKLDNKIYFLCVDLENGNLEADEDKFYEMLSRRDENNTLLDFTSNDAEEIQEHLSDIKSAISQSKELLNIPDYKNS